MKRVYLGNKELTALGVGGGGDDNQKWVDYFNGTLTEFTVPEGVTKISESKFAYCTGLTSVTIPDSVANIGYAAFGNCYALTGITVNAARISNYAFEYCTGLTSVVLGNSVKKIDNYAFKDCSSLSSVTIGTGIAEIGDYVFYNCSKLKTMVIKATTPPTLGSYNNTIPSTIETIYVPAESVDAYKSATYWNNYASKIHTAPMTVKYTDNSTKQFYNLTSIENNTDPNKANAKEVFIGDSVNIIGDSAFEGSHNLTSITLPTSLTQIGTYAFSGCWSLTDIVIPDNVTSIAYKAFYNCSSLTGITISRNVAKIDNSTFEGCDKLTSVVLPESVATINSGAFNGCSSLSSVTIQNSASKLTYSNNAFGHISSSAKLYVPSNLLSDYQADSAWTGAFRGGIYALQTPVKTPSMKVTYTDNSVKRFYDLTTIASDTDNNKANAKEVVIGNGVTNIGSYAFNGCTGLTSVTLTDSLTEISWSAFRDCSSLTSITIPDNVTKIADNAFNGCTGLTSVTIGNSVVNIVNSAFANCTSLASVTIKNSNSKLTYSYQAFEGISSNAKLYVPSNLLADYQADSNWTGAFRGGIYAIQ